jgi:hypothetical protein
MTISTKYIGMDVHKESISNRGNSEIVEQNLRLHECSGVWYFGSSYDAGVLPASFFANGSQGCLLVTQTYLSRWATAAPLPHAKRPPPGGYVQTLIGQVTSTGMVPRPTDFRIDTAFSVEVILFSESRRR